MYKLILVEPESEGNIGFIARLMQNFGFKELIMVNPKFKIGEEAKKRAVHAQEILEEAKIYKSFEKSVKELDMIVGTTGVKTTDQNFLRKGVPPEKISKNISNSKNKIGFVFGRESTGLTNNELKKCDLVVKIPSSEKYPVLNLSHAVGIVLYEVYKQEIRDEKKTSGISSQEKQILENLYKGILEKFDYPNKKREQLDRCLKNIFNRSFIYQEEAHRLIGFFKDVKNKIS